MQRQHAAKATPGLVVACAVVLLQKVFSLNLPGSGRVQLADESIEAPLQCKQLGARDRFT